MLRAANTTYGNLEDPPDRLSMFLQQLKLNDIQK